MTKDKITIDQVYLKNILEKLLSIPSPTGFTDEIVRFTGEELKRLGIEFEITRRGAIRANLNGKLRSPDRAIVVHLDTIGCMVKQLKKNGRLGIVPIGHWSSRFAEGARVRVFSDNCRTKGTILPLKSSGHTFNEEINEQPIGWEYVEVRLDERFENDSDLLQKGIYVGDFVAVEPNPEFMNNGYIISRHLDNKAGVAALLAAAKALLDAEAELHVDCHLLFTITEEIGSGASAVLHQDVAEMLTVDNATPAEGQNSREFGVTIAMMDSSGPFDYHLTHKLIDLCHLHDIPHQRDVFLHYRCDSAAAVEAGNDIRTALLSFGVDSSHAYERTNIDALHSVSKLLTLYMQSSPTVMRDQDELSGLEGFPVQRVSS
jgi:peptidase M42 family hydrolase